MNYLKRLTCLTTTFLMTLTYFPLRVFADIPFATKPTIIPKIQKLIQEYNFLINGIWGVLLTLAVGVFVIHFIKLGAYGDRPLGREKIMRDILISGICVAMLGSFWFVYSLLISIAFS